MSVIHTIDSTSIFRAVSSSTKQLFQLLNCIRFASKACVQINEDGLRFSAEESRVMQGTVFLDRALFTSYTFNPTLSSEGDPSPDPPSFQISVPALLETLQIFGAAEGTGRFSNNTAQSDYASITRPNRPHAFSNAALGVSGLCRLSYVADGSPFSIVLEEAGVTTTCNLHTYEPEFPSDIPFARDAIQIKIIMSARWLYDAIMELSAANPSRIDIMVLPSAPYFTLAAVGNFGSSAIDFAKGRELLETFSVESRWMQGYKFELIKAASDAMRLASKVSIRGDDQGVLSVQFMVEVEGGSVSFIDFRFVPFVSEGDESDLDYEEGGSEETPDN